ncbi:MAG: hypothetical protein P8J87_11130 [Verrucomicrobiales bacterium]|nr:hypothetical protein [Verrucomicrobiales bacterium]
MTSENTETGLKGSGARWALVLGALYILGMLGLGFGLGEASSDRGWVEWMGRFHFLMVHLPIGLLLLVISIEAAALVLKVARPARAAVPFTLWMAACGAVAATIFGLMLSKTGGYNEVILERHLWAGTAVAVGTFLTLTLKLALDAGGGKRLQVGYGIILVMTVGTLKLASHLGGTLTHGEGFLTKAMPNELRGVLGMEVEEEKPQVASVEELEVFSGVISPLFESKCTECHGETKQKGEYRMDTFESIVAGGDTGAGVVPGDLDGSELWYRIVTDDEDDVMPPEGEKALSEDEIAVVRWWIEKGAENGKRVGELGADAEVIGAIEAIVKIAKAG